MSQPSVDDLKRLVTGVVFPFYRIERDIPIPFTAGRQENDAEHSWSLAFIACALAPEIDPGLDIGLVCQFATVHDLVELYAGDTSNFASEAKKAGKADREHKALERLTKEYKRFPWIAETIATYEKQESEEARFVKAVDKVIVLLFDYIEEGLFYHERKITTQEWRLKMQKHREKASKHPGAFKYYDELWNLLLANPNFFYQESP
jgi:5'-deoxynucleotidase YfbR-like HD superfamily hydrolase